MTCRECVKRKNKQFVQVKGTLLNYLQPTVGGAWDLLTKLLATSKQVLGPHHSTTKEIELTHKKDERRKRLTKLPATSK